MDVKVKDLLKHLVSLPDIRFVLSEAYENLDTGDLVSVVERLLEWNRIVYTDDDNFGQYFETEFVLNPGPQKERFDSVFGYSPILNLIFSLENNKVVYNKNLSSDEIAEIQKYIYEHRRKRRFLFPPRIRKK